MAANVEFICVNISIRFLFFSFVPLVSRRAAFAAQRVTCRRRRMVDILLYLPLMIMVMVMLLLLLLLLVVLLVRHNSLCAASLGEL